IARSSAACAAMMEALVPAFERMQLKSLEELSVGVAWLEGCDPLIRARVEEAGSRFPHRRRLDVPPGDVSGSAVLPEVADVHRELFAEYADLYGSDVRRKVDRCLAVSDAEYERALTERAAFRERFEEAVAGVDLLLTPTLALVAPPVGAREDDVLRER